MNRKKFALSIGVTTALLALGGGTVYAVETVAPLVSTFRTGSYSSKQYFASQTDAYAFSTPNAWVTLPSTTITVIVPSGASRLVNARFSGESLCTGTSWCSMRIVYRPYTTGVITEMSPGSGADFAWDTPGGSWETNMIERSTSTFLGAGSYHVMVQAQLVSPTSSPQMRIDDYHLAVAMVNP